MRGNVGEAYTPRYTLFIAKLVGPSHYIFIRQQNNSFDYAQLLLQASMHVQIVRLAVQRTSTGLLLRVDKYEPHNFRQFGN